MDVNVPDGGTKLKTINSSNPIRQNTSGIADGQILTCADCSFQTTSVRKLGRHRSVNHAGVKYRCEHCDFVTGYQSNYYRHRKQVHCGKETTFGCSKCDFSAQTNEGLIVHMSQMHREHWACPQCNIMLNTKSQFQEHMRTYHGHKLGLTLNPNPMRPSDSTAALASAYNEAALAALAASMNPSMGGMFNMPNPYGAFNSSFGSFGAPTTASPDLMSALLPAYMRAQLAMLSASALAASVNGGRTAPVSLPLPLQSPAMNLPTPETHTPLKVDDDYSDVKHELDSDTISPVNNENEDSERMQSIKPETVDENENVGMVVDESAPVHEDVVDTVVNGETPEPTRKCSLCRYETADAARFKKHIRCHQTTAETECRQCDFKTVYSWNLDRHVRCHGVSGRYTCLRCSFSQNTRQSMTYHLQNHHNIRMITAQTQTDASLLEVPFDVQVCREPYIFEQHAVKYNADFQPIRDHSPAYKSVHSEAHTTGKCSSAPPSHLAGVDCSKYLSEHEAIEAPPDDNDLKDLESDPDIKSRTCSICGYQGKWISEMIRHKRVHTNERPFRCKYCSRTSKWKADLIRHLLKVHGVRVVSKYSRSKTFDSDANVMRALKEAHGYIDADVHDFETHADVLQTDDATLDLSMKKDCDMDARSSSASGHSNKSAKFCAGSDVYGSSRETSPESVSSSSSVVKLWVCCICQLHSDNQDAALAHLETAHCQPPYACPVCQFSALQRQVVGVHVVSEHGLPGEHIVENMRVVYKQADMGVPVKRKSPILTQHMLSDTKRARLEARGSISTDCCSMGTGDSISTAASPPGSTTSSTPEPGQSRRESNISTFTNGQTKLTCALCPFNVQPNDMLMMENHVKCHEPPKGGLFYYKCTYCNWYAKKKHSMYDHLMLHTHAADEAMQQVESNMITHQHQDMPMDLTQKKRSSQPAECTPQNESSLLSDFGAILEAAGEEEPKRDASTEHQSSMEQSMFYQSISDAATSDSEPDIEDEESYLHAGEDALDLNSYGGVETPAEIQKISIAEEGGESRKMWQCRFCPHVSKRRANVRMHEKKHFKSNPVGLLKCPKCNYRGDRRSLNAHYRVHCTSEGTCMPERYPCSRCPGNFRSEVDLKRHTQFHASQLPITCPKCDYATHTDREMLLHTQVHRASVNDYVSVVVDEDADCDSSSSSSLVSPNESNDNITSKNTHNGVVAKAKKHMCDECPARFSDRTQLSRHCSFHNSGLSHQCTLCTYAVSFPINLNKHLRSHHAINHTDTTNATSTL